MDTSSKTRLNEDVDVLDEPAADSDVRKKSLGEALSCPPLTGLYNYVVDTFYCCSSISDIVSPNDVSSAKTERSAYELTREYVEKDKKKRPDAIFKYITFLIDRPGEEIRRDFIELLESKGALFDYRLIDTGKIKLNVGESLLHQACQLKNKNQLEIFKYLMVKTKTSKKELHAHVNQNGHTILHYACYYDNEELVKYLLELREETEKDPELMLINAKTDKERQTPLHYACKKDSLKSVRCLIENNANKEAKDSMGRTPLYLAAEYGRKNILKYLIDNGCNINVKNTKGQKAIYWIVAKCPDMASEILDKYREGSRLTRKWVYHLRHVELEPLDDENSSLPKARSLLSYIVETQNLDLIIHPVMVQLVKHKWRKYGRYKAYVDIVLTIVNIVAWNLLADIVPWNQKHIYKFPDDGWRIFLFVLGVLGMLLLILLELSEMLFASRYYEMVRKQRTEELDHEESVCHPLHSDQMEFIREERKMCRKVQVFRNYVSDAWNWFDIISIMLLSACVFTHIADIVNHTEIIARAHIRLMSVTVIFIALRLLKTGRVLHEEFGMLVMTLYFVVRDIAVWIVAFIIIWIPFTSAFWMLYGGYQLSCNNLISKANCTEINVNGMDTYNRAAFILYLFTFGGDLDTPDMITLDPIMVYILQGFYLAMTTLLLVNIFIALLTSTFNRVHDSSKAYFILQRASEILQIEYAMTGGFANFKRNYFKGLEKPIHDDRFMYNMAKENTAEKMEPVKESLKGIRDEISDLNRNIQDMEANMKMNEDELESELSIYSGSTQSLRLRHPRHARESDNQMLEAPDNDQLGKIKIEVQDLGDLVQKLLERKNVENNRYLMENSRNPRVDVLNINDYQMGSGANLSNVIGPRRDDFRN